MAIIAAVDRSERAPKVVREAESLAEAFDDTVHLVHVLTQSEFMDLERTSVNETGSALNMDQVRSVAKDIAAEAGSDLNVPAEAVGLMGDPADQVVKYADEHEARYIVVGPKSRSPTGKVLFGSVAQSILLNADCSVVTTRAE